jgi:nucleoside phosphorylase
MSDPDNYSIGWICAITTEYVAAQAFLQERHDGPKQVSLHDNNNYTLGRIGLHNIVIAVLPYGEYGLSSAASVARDMLHSFPNIKIGLMVGIGGGAPSEKHDIRLGDVVVGVNAGQSGVIQYDFGKAVQDQEFQETGFLNQPPTLLRAAISGLMAQHQLYGNQLEVAIDNALNTYQRLKRGYRRPEVTTDRLYHSQIVHPPNSESVCAVCCGDDPSRLVKRRERGEEDDDDVVMIHYGLIASANTLMKDAGIRDRLVAKKDVLCFEMEAAGLMNHFPCLVIRGICDYSDSHKNKKWQGYAAMAAAAYARDLLLQIAPNKIEAEEKISDILSGKSEITTC